MKLVFLLGPSAFSWDKHYFDGHPATVLSNDPCAEQLSPRGTNGRTCSCRPPPLSHHSHLLIPLGMSDPSPASELWPLGGVTSQADSPAWLWRGDGDGQREATSRDPERRAQG